MKKKQKLKTILHKFPSVYIEDRLKMYRPLLKKTMEITTVEKIYIIIE